MNDLDGERVGRARMKEIVEIIRDQMVERSLNWSGVAYPSEGWATQIYGEPDVERLWEAVAFCTRLDEADPVQAWRDHMARLEGRGEDPDRARARRRPLHGSRHRSDRRAEPERALDVGAVPDARRDRVRPEHADGRGVHDARLPPRGGHDPLEPPARARRRHHRGASADGEGREDRRRPGRQGRRHRARAARDRRPRRATSASSRSSTAPRASARRTRRSSTRSTTRTRRATSPTASASPRCSTATRARA